MHVYILKVWHHAKIRLHYSMHIYLKNNCAKFNLDPIWSDRALGFLKSVLRRKNKMSGDIGWDQFLIPKCRVYSILARGSMYAERAICYHHSVCPSVCHMCISQKWLNLESRNLHPTVPPSSSFCVISFIQKFWRVFCEWGHQTRWGGENNYFLILCVIISKGEQQKIRPKLSLTFIANVCCRTSNEFARWRHCHALTLASAGLSRLKTIFLLYLI